MRYSVVINGFFVGSVLLGNTLPAFALGGTDPLSFHGNGSRVIDTGTPSASLPVSIMAEQVTSSANATTSAAYSSGGKVSAQATTSDYRFDGSLSASGYDKAWRSGGYVRDEISFDAVSSGIYTIDFVFNVNASAQLFNPSGRTDLMLTMSYWDGLSYKSVATQNLLSLTNDMATRTVSGTYHLLLAGVDRTQLTATDGATYLPYTIGLWGDAANGTISWNNVMLTDVVVTDNAGVVLIPGSYELQSESMTLNAVAAPAEVPLPGAIGLLGAGLAGLVSLRARREVRFC